MRWPRHPLSSAAGLVLGIAALYGLSSLASHGSAAVRRDLQRHFADLHEFLSADGDSASVTGDAVQRNQRDNVTNPLAAAEGEISWSLLAKASFSEENGEARPVTTEAIRALDRRMVRIRGYIFPLDQAAKPSHFLLSPYPPSCPFCLPAGPSELIEVTLATPTDFTDRPITVSGRFEILHGEAMKEGMFYRLTAAHADPRE